MILSNFNIFDSYVEDLYKKKSNPNILVIESKQSGLSILNTVKRVQIDLFTSQIENSVVFITYSEDVYIYVTTRISKFPMIKEICYIQDEKSPIENYIKYMKFDYVIMNPPFSVGGEVWDSARSHCDSEEGVVCLMPLSKYKAKNRIQYVNFNKFTLADGRLFDAATITDNLCITVSTISKNDKTYEDFLLKSFNPSYQVFYEENGKRYRGLEPKVGFKVKYSSLNLNLDFVESHRSSSSHAGNGFGSGSAGYKWNHYEMDTSLSKENGIPKDSFSGCFTLRFKDKVEKSNFSTWWYSNSKGKGLSSKVIMGTNLDNVVGTCRYAIPQIDWATISDHPLWKEGKYDESVLDTMGLKWNEDMSGVVRK